MTELEKEFLASLQALLVRYNVSLVHANSNHLAFVTNSETEDNEQFIYVSVDDAYRALKVN